MHSSVTNGGEMVQCVCMIDARRFAKDRLDIGLMTDDPAMIEFVADEIGLGAPELLRVSRTVTQHRFDLRGSVVKVNIVPGLEATARSGFRELVLADATASQVRRLTGPDGVVFSIVPKGWGGVDHMAVRLTVPDVVVARRHFADALRWDVDGALVRLGASAVLLEESDDAPTSVPPATRGWTYLTVQVRDCDAETAAAVAGGAAVVRQPRTHGEVARFSMVADPWGNQIELSQRASLTGPLPPNDD